MKHREHAGKNSPNAGKKQFKRIDAAKQHKPNKFMRYLPLAVGIVIIPIAVRFMYPKFFPNQKKADTAQVSDPAQQDQISNQAQQNVSQTMLVSEIARSARHLVAEITLQADQVKTYNAARDAINAAKYKTADYPDGIVLPDISGTIHPEGKKPLEYFIPTIVAEQANYIEITYDSRLMALGQLLDMLALGKGNGTWDIEKLVKMCIESCSRGRKWYSSYRLDEVLARDVVMCTDIATIVASFYYLRNQTPMLIMLWPIGEGKSTASEGHVVVGVKKGDRIMISDPLMSPSIPVSASLEDYYRFTRAPLFIANEIKGHLPTGVIGGVALYRFLSRAEVPQKFLQPMMNNEDNYPGMEEWAFNTVNKKNLQSFARFKILCPDMNLNFDSRVLDRLFIETGYAYVDTNTIFNLQSKLTESKQSAP